MARGDIHWFTSFDLKSKSGVSFNLATDALKVGIVTNATVPTVATPDPRWGSGGSTNFLTNQVPTGTAYTGPVPLTNVTWSTVSGVNTLKCDDVTIPQDFANGFDTAAYAIIFDDTTAGKYAIGFMDLGGPLTIDNGPLILKWAAGGVFNGTAG